VLEAKLGEKATVKILDSDK